MRRVSLQAALTACAWAAGAAAGTDGGVPVHSLHAFDIPGVVDVVDVPGESLVAGLPVAMHAVRSRVGAERLAESLLEQLHLAGLYVPPPSEVQARVEGLQVTGLDPDALVAYTFFLLPEAGGGTTVLVTETFVGRKVQEALSSVDFAPVMPGARSPITTRTEGVQAVHYETPEPPEAVRAFYREQLSAAGYSESGKDEWTRGEWMLKLSVSSAASQSSVHVLQRRAYHRVPEATAVPGADGP